MRGMLDFSNKPLAAAGPSTPVEVLGLENVPAVGAILGELAEVKEAEETQSLVDKLRQGENKTLKIIIKADKQGSLEAIQASLEKFNEERKIIDYVFSGTGDIGEENVKLAQSVGAIVIVFNVKVAPIAQKMAINEHVLIRTYNIIYELLDEISEVVEGMLKVGALEEVFVTAQILVEFPYGDNQRIAGCKVLEGSITKGPKIKIIRGEEVIGETKLKSLKKAKEEVTRVEKGNECGMMFEPVVEFQVGDIIQSFRTL